MCYHEYDIKMIIHLRRTPTFRICFIEEMIFFFSNQKDDILYVLLIGKIMTG